MVEIVDIFRVLWISYVVNREYCNDVVKIIWHNLNQKTQGKTQKETKDKHTAAGRRCGGGRWPKLRKNRRLRRALEYKMSQMYNFVHKN